MRSDHSYRQGNSTPFSRRFVYDARHAARQARLHAVRWLIPLALVIGAFQLSTADPASAVIEPIYTLPFYDTYNLSCGFGCYSGHEGVDYELGVFGAGGERVVSAASGTAKPCPRPA